MSVPKRTATIVIARQMRQYREGDRVKILRGRMAGMILTVRQSENDWVLFRETLSREVMSKGNCEPEHGFTEDEMIVARRAAEKMQGMGSLV